MLKLLQVLLFISAFSALHSQTISSYADGATLSGPEQMAIDKEDNVYVSEFWGGKIQKISPQGRVSIFAGGGPNGASVGFRDGPPDVALFRNPQGICFDSLNNVYYVADTGNHAIRRIDSSGVVTTLAGGPAYGYRDGPILTALFDEPVYITCDRLGNVYVADNFNHAIRKIDVSTELVSTLAGNGAPGLVNGPTNQAQFDNPRGVAVDSDFNVYVADFGNIRIRKISADSVVSTVAGSGIYPGHQDGPGSSARFNFPKGISLDAENNIYVADRINFVVRKIDTSYNVTTIAGIVGQSDYIDGPLAEGAIGRPVYATPFQDGNLLISDWVNNVMRIVDFDGVITSTIALVDVDVKVSPNPSSNLFNISSPEQQVEAYYIYDSRMQLIKQDAKLNLNALQIDLSGFPSGVFILQLNLAEGIVTKKLIKG